MSLVGRSTNSLLKGLKVSLKQLGKKKKKKTSKFQKPTKI